MEEQHKQMVDMLTRQMKAQIDAMSSKEMTDALAKFAKGYFDSLMEQGFGREEALEIVKAANSKK